MFPEKFPEILNFWKIYNPNWTSTREVCTRAGQFTNDRFNLTYFRIDSNHRCVVNVLCRAWVTHRLMWPSWDQVSNQRHTLWHKIC